MYSKGIEDYLEAIYNIILRKGYARTKDIAEELNVTSPSVSAMLKKLHSEDLIFYERYSGVTLAPEGEELAKSIKHRHDTLTKLLKIIFVSEDVAERDACNLEHNLSPESITQLTNFVNFIESRPIHPQWLEHFKTFCETGDYECKKLKDRG
ncbi:MAG: hypothetical protein A7316_00720 [Candidatus Altiarchaeales archaeon WOR_SM1_86-2]|nr:MAG: hypothetical protein A7315_05360 [Candidatus Altiarchaeales archaeon WOR_SM1_79]ODS39031.1 MAG: hypothetical protein A7316_00720 [Candidatus Altiarchaeales archaeon WOR_SM1_86-2]